MASFKPAYEPPIAMDLSGRTAEGHSRGTCMNGTGLYSVITCVTGIAPESGDPTGCRPTGLDPEYGGCDYGHRAANNCISGTAF